MEEELKFKEIEFVDLNETHIEFSQSEVSRTDMYVEIFSGTGKYIYLNPDQIQELKQFLNNNF